MEMVRDEEWMKMKEEIHQQSLVWRKCLEEEKKRKYTFIEREPFVIRVDKDYFII